MDENRRGYNLKALGPSGAGSPMRLPGRGSFPRVDDHLVEAEVTRDEIIGGHRIVASPAHPPHATQHTRLGYVLQARVAPGYIGATDLLTRHDQESDFASDVCIYKDGVDPATGARYLEEIAFEVVSEQNERWVTEKARRMHRRGVRRIFSVWVKTQRVCEWSSERESWHPLEAGARIEDPCLIEPVLVSALLDAAGADDSVLEALAAKGNPALQQREAAAEARGNAEGRAQAILRVLEVRGLAVSAEKRREILDCHDFDRLDRWLARAAVASSADEITANS
jgi:Putative restriction endonuclease